jgi:uncharacterized DUF497 family protein
MRRVVWDPGKARANLRKHRVSFAEAATVLTDPLARYMPDPDHADREIGIGMATGGDLLVVVFSERDEMIRIISAREANRHERKETKKAERAPEMREHYDFSRAKRGRFPDLVGGHVVTVSPELWKHFGSEAAVVSALEEIAVGAKPPPAPKRKRRVA